MYAAKIAIRVLSTPKEREISQIQLADMLNVSPQHNSKILKGRENLNLETLVKLENTLSIKLINITQ